jgi:hypothetical protein
MIELTITGKELELAKDVTKEFDKIKTYNKFECKKNYIGFLGELKLHQYLTDKKVEHEWIKFLKQGYSEPDFKIENATIDLKTSYSYYMSFRQPIWDIYIFAQINQSDTLLTLKSFTTKKDMLRMIDSGGFPLVNKSYQVYPFNMRDIEEIFGGKNV